MSEYELIPEDWGGQTIFANVSAKTGEGIEELLEMILGKKIRDLRYAEVDQSMDNKGVCLDAYLEDSDNTVCGIEMQTTKKGDLPKLARYCHRVSDLNFLEKGKDYRELKKSYVIFFCKENPFKKGRHLYRFENFCNEDKELSLGDDTTTVFLTPDGWEKDISEELLDFLEYLAGRGGNSSFVKRLDKAVCQARSRDEWRSEYMHLDSLFLEKYAEGKEEGLTEGRMEGLAQGRAEERKSAIGKLLEKEMSEEFILSLGYTEEEILEVKQDLTSL